jgi:hypothetical protein
MILSFILQNANVQASNQGQVQGSDTQGGPNTVLRVIVEHMIYPISLDILYQVSYILTDLFLLFFLSLKLIVLKLQDDTLQVRR